MPKPFPADFRLFLASQSPRRRDLLDVAAVPHLVVPSLALETGAGEGPESIAEANALAKARQAVLPPELGQRTFVLGTDTVVSVEGRILGKPSGRQEAGQMLRALQGREHVVVSGVVLRLLERGSTPRERVAHARTEVRFCLLEDADVEAYLDSCEWEGKAGGYAIQGLAALFVEGISGDYANVVGLPLNLLSGLFRELGFDILRRDWRDS